MWVNVLSFTELDDIEKNSIFKGVEKNIDGNGIGKVRF